MSSPPLIHGLGGALLRERIAALFEARGYRHRFWTTFREYARRPGEVAPDLVICELTPCAAEVYGLCRSLRQDPRTEDTPVLLIGDRVDAPTLLGALDSGADEVLGGFHDDQSLEEKIDVLLAGGRRARRSSEAEGGTGPTGRVPTSGSCAVEAVERLAGVVAHEFNNTLMVIKGFNEVTELSFDGDDERRRFTGEITKATERAMGFCGALMRLSGRDSGVLGPVDLCGVLAELRPHLEESVGEHIRVRVDCLAGIGRIAADSERLKQTISSICLNSKEAMPNGGEFSVEVRRDVSQSAEESGPSAQTVVVELRDTGTGISPETLVHVFEPGYTTKAAHQGLGLSLACETLKQFGGRIECTSLVGDGTTVRLYFKNFDAEDATDA